MKVLLFEYEDKLRPTSHVLMNSRANAPVRVRELPAGPPKFSLLFIIMYAIENFHHFPEIRFASKNVERANKTRARAKFPKP